MEKTRTFLRQAFGADVCSHDGNRTLILTSTSFLCFEHDRLVAYDGDEESAWCWLRTGNFPTYRDGATYAVTEHNEGFDVTTSIPAEDVDVDPDTFDAIDGHTFRVGRHTGLDFAGVCALFDGAGLVFESTSADCL